MGDYSQAILYHHINSEFLDDNTINPELIFYADLIHLSDRIDILIQKNSCDNINSFLHEYKPGVFSDKAIELFVNSNQDNCLVNNIKNGLFKNDVLNICNNIDLNPSLNLKYLQMLPFLIDFRSPFTVTHTAATVSITLCLTELFSLSQKEKTELYYASLLHDMGKIATPLEILESSNKLSYEEMLIMKTHVNSTEDIIRNVVPDNICNIAINHHEKLNGSGYPRGLSSADLNIQDRILAVSDIASALIGVRSYKKSYSPEKTISILNSMADNGEICVEVVNMLTDNIDTVIQTAQSSIKQVKDVYSKIYTDFYTLKEKLNTLT